jgi:superfamily II DNA or RNA helicase
MGIKLFEHNQTAYDTAVSLMAETGKAAVIHPTGTGKSFIGFKLAEQRSEARICWLSPSEHIYKTQLENLKNATDGYSPENIYFMTYAKLLMSSKKVIEELNPDYIVLDEFHRCGALEWGKGVKRLLDAYFDVSSLGLSATNIRYLDNQRDMADELFDGNVASVMTLGESIVRNILLPPIYNINILLPKRF